MEHRRASTFSHSPPPLLAQRTRAHLAYKNKGGLKQDDLRRRREEQQVEIRRQKREENIAKRRNFLPTSAADSDEETTARDWEPPVRVVHPRSGILHSHILSLRRK